MAQILTHLKCMSFCCMYLDMHFWVLLIPAWGSPKGEFILLIQVFVCKLTKVVYFKSAHLGTNLLWGQLDKLFLEKTQHTCLLAPDRDKSMEATRAQLGEPVSFTGVSCRNMGVGLFMGADMTQRQLHHQVPFQPGWQSWEPGAHCIACRQLNRLERVLSRVSGLTFFRQLHWFLLLSSSWSGLKSLLCNMVSLSPKGTQISWLLWQEEV